MHKALLPLPLEKDPRLLVGMETADDAGVYQLSEHLALVQTVDFITPIVDDPFLFGQIAAANSLSDVYAMGGKPLTAMNVVGFPRCSLDLSVLSAILAGGLAKIHEAGAVLVGGHTVDDEELKYGLSVTGTIHPQKVITNREARPGDVLLLTKPLGTGIISTAHKAGMVPPDVLQGAVDSMLRLNDRAAQLMAESGTHACTDVTGFGLLGHACEMARGSSCSFRLCYSRLPILRGAAELAAQGLIPGGAYANEQHFRPWVSFSPAVPGWQRIIPYDPQTSGGLLLAVPEAAGEALLQRLSQEGIEARHIGEVRGPEGDTLISVEY